MEHLKVASLQAPALPESIRLDWRGLPGTNTLALSDPFVNYKKKVFITFLTRTQSPIVQSSIRFPKNKYTIDTINLATRLCQDTQVRQPFLSLR